MLGNTCAVLVPCHGVKSVVGYPQQCKVKTPGWNQGGSKYPFLLLSDLTRIHVFCWDNYGLQIRSKSWLSRSVSSRDPQYSRIQPGLWLSSGRGCGQGPKPLAYMCGEILQLFGKGQSHLGHTQRPGSLHSRLLQLLLVGMCGCWQGRCLQQGCWPGAAWLRSSRGDLTCRIISKAFLCVTWLHAAGFVPGYFGTTVERLPGTRSWPWPPGAFGRSCPGRSPGHSGGR